MLDFEAEFELGDLDFIESYSNKLQAELNEKMEWAAKEELEDFAEDLQDYLQQALYDFYDKYPEVAKYDRTGEFEDSIKVRVTQGGGYYGLQLYFDDEEIHFHKGAKGKYNAHGHSPDDVIEADVLARVESGRKRDIPEYLRIKALEYVDANLDNRVSVSFQKAFRESFM
jgi:replicative superfamily II helicase